MADTTVVVTTQEVQVATIGVQGPAGPNAILNKNVAVGTVTANGSIINYNSTTDKWEATVQPTGLIIQGGNF